MSLTGWTPRSPEVKQPHRVKSKGVGGPGGPLRTDYRRLWDNLEVWGIQQNPSRLGMTGDQRLIVSLRDKFEHLSRNPNIRKQFSTVAPCRACRERGREEPRFVNGRGLCLPHEWLRGEGLLGYYVEGTTYATARVRLSL